MMGCEPDLQRQELWRHETTNSGENCFYCQRRPPVVAVENCLLSKSGLFVIILGVIWKSFHRHTQTLCWLVFRDGGWW